MASKVLLFALCCIKVGLVLSWGQPKCKGETANSVAAMAGNLTSKLVIVTGGDGGIGQAVVESFARQKAIVIIATRNVEKATRVARSIAARTHGDVQAMHLDLSSLASVRRFAEQFLAKFDGKLHYLINNAGVDGLHGSYMTEDNYELTFQVNYLGHFLLSELLLPALRKNRPSRIVNVASTASVLACQAAGWSLAVAPTAMCLRDWEMKLPHRAPLTGTQPWYPQYFLPGQHA
jgi:NAD(P)-dependent dehydrogenase (short-subunit alcohol dehydrogenase family)